MTILAYCALTYLVVKCGYAAAIKLAVSWVRRKVEENEEQEIEPW
jgi:hypothetical protein